MNDLFGLLNSSSARNFMQATSYVKEGIVNLDIDVPGFKKEEIDISIQNGSLKVNAKTEETINEEGVEFIHRERATSCCRVFKVSTYLKPEDFTVSLNNGVLHIEFPANKEAPASETHISIT